MRNHLITPEEIYDAARWRLRKLTPDQVDAGLEAVVALLERAAPLYRDSQEVTQALAGIEDGASRWSLLCSLLVLVAGTSHDVSLFYRAGFEVLIAHEQAQRGGVRRRGDALDNLIAQYLVELEDIRPTDLWLDFCQQAEDGGSDVLDGYDGARLNYQAHPHDEKLTGIDFCAFRKRVQRLRKKVLPQVRHVPVSVAAPGVRWAA
ncbi:MAG TPA: hypothetical protein VMV91_14850 [Rhodocyclaceae bacterium]|nr:hypothetical protein [Rhodocyclaceae bacterium]